jgi:MFS family permease
MIGLAELPIALAESVTRSSSESFTLSVTRDVGWWLIAVIGVIGLIVFALSIRFAGRGGRRALNPLIAAVTGVAAVVVAFGPLVPVGDATFADNFRSTDPSQNLPVAFIAGRLGQVALIALVGVVGMLIVRSWGIGFAAGGLGVAALMWVTSLTRLGDRPIGIADRNPGAITTVPHAVTTVGMISALVLLAVAAALGAYRLNRRPSA